MKTHAELKSLLQAALASAMCGDDELLDRALIEICEDGNIESIKEIVAYLREQANLRAPENDVAGILLSVALRIERDVDALEGCRHRWVADKTGLIDTCEKCGEQRA